ncbi:hypothetical protein VTO42DRAFT_7208 [Malbranchea cinnamomea]
MVGRRRENTRSDESGEAVDSGCHSSMLLTDLQLLEWVALKERYRRTADGLPHSVTKAPLPSPGGLQTVFNDRVTVSPASGPVKTLLLHRRAPGEGLSSRARRTCS